MVRQRATIDLLGYRHLVGALLSIAQADRLLPATIGVFGDWGSGKSSLIRMACEAIKDEKTLVISFNGWLFEGYEDAKTAIMGKLRIKKARAGVAKLGAKQAPSAGVLDGEPRSLATGLATAQRNWRNRWRNSATPAGFEIESRDFPKTKRDATLAGKSLNIRRNVAPSRDESCRLELSRAAQSRHSDGTVTLDFSGYRERFITSRPDRWLGKSKRRRGRDAAPPS